MKILVLGGTGFLGSFLCEYLLKYGHEVGIYKRKNSNNLNIKSCEKYLHIVFGNFIEENNFDKIIKGYDCVYHLISNTVPSLNKPMNDIEFTIKPTLKLLDACVKNNIKKIIFFSSGGTVYGIPKSIPIKETHPTDPISSYGIHKLMIEKYLEFYYRMYGLDYTILRIANPYGPRQKPFSNQGLIANILGKYLAHQTIDIWGDGSSVRDYVYVTDVIEASIKILNYTGKEKIFNIGSGKGDSINDIINIIENIVNHKLDIQRLESRKQDVPVNILDIDLIKKELNWQPRIGLDIGIKNMIRAWDIVERNFTKIEV
ncbi:NAD-dependent epimerase/dehydratase family protein [Megamonas sp.]